MAYNFTYECTFKKQGEEQLITKTATGDIDFVLSENWQFSPVLTLNEYVNDVDNSVSGLYNIYKDLNYQCTDITFYFIDPENPSKKHILLSKEKLNLIDFKTIPQGGTIDDSTTHSGSINKILEIR